MTLLGIENLTIEVAGKALVRDASLAIREGELVVLVGESGAGKTTLARACIGALPPGASARGKVFVATTNGRAVDIVAAEPRVVRALRSSHVRFVPHPERGPLDPLRRAGRMARAEGVSDFGSLARTLARLGLPDAKRTLSAFPSTLSGGEAERVMIAIAAELPTRLLIVDEPTVGLDGKEKRSVFDLLRERSRRQGSAVLILTHDLDLAGRADSLFVMKDGTLVDEARGPSPRERLGHPYSRRLFAIAADPLLFSREEGGLP